MRYTPFPHGGINSTVRLGARIAHEVHEAALKCHKRRRLLVHIQDVKVLGETIMRMWYTLIPHGGINSALKSGVRTAHAVNQAVL